MMIQAIRFAVRTSIKSVLTPTTSAIPLCRSLENGAIPAAAHGQTRLLRSVIGGSNDSVGVRSRSGEEEELRGLSAEEISRIGERTQQMWKEHIALNTSFPEASLPPRGSEASVDPETLRRKRLVYRSKQRGWLEVDLLLGTWAEKNVPTLTLEEMNNYEVILNLETIDIFNFITGNAEPPSFVDTSMMKRLQEYAMSNPLGQSPESYAMEKRRSNLT